MGIKPSGDNPIIVPPDNIQSRWGEWEADLDAAGQEAGDVHLETWSLADSANTWISQNSSKVEGLIEDSAGLGEEAKTIQQQMRELLDPENPNSELWILQDEVNTLQTERADLHQQMIELNRQDIDRQAEFFSRFLFVPGFEGASDENFKVTPSGSQWRVEALGAWTGRYTLQSAYFHSGRNAWEPVIDVETVPRTDPTNPRVRYHNGGEYSTVINYWVRNAIHEVDDKATGSYTTGAWTTRPELTFTAPISADYAIYYQVVWGAATYDDIYGFRIQRNGTTIMEWGPMTRVGPISRFDSGVRTRSLNEMAVPLSAGDVLTFQTDSNAGTASQRNVRSSQRKISWVVPASDKSMATTLSTTGDGGFTRDQETGQNIQWGGTNSIRFVDHDVSADRNVMVHNPTTNLYEPVAAGDNITAVRWIRTAEPHPDRVTFTRRS